MRARTIVALAGSPTSAAISARIGPVIMSAILGPEWAGQFHVRFWHDLRTSRSPSSEITDQGNPLDVQDRRSDDEPGGLTEARKTLTCCLPRVLSSHGRNAHGDFQA